MNQERAADPGTRVEEQLRLLDEAVGRLGARDRIVMLMGYYRGMKVEEIGRELGVSEGAARRRIEREVRKLQVKIRVESLTDGVWDKVGAITGGTALSAQLMARDSLAVARSNDLPFLREELLAEHGRVARLGERLEDALLQLAAANDNADASAKASSSGTADGKSATELRQATSAVQTLQKHHTDGRIRLQDLDRFYAEYEVKARTVHVLEEARDQLVVRVVMAGGSHQ